MSPFRLVIATVLLLPSVCDAQTANGSPTAPPPPGLAGAPRPVSRAAPSVGTRRAGDAPAQAPLARQKTPKQTAADRAEQRQLEHDLHICIGC